MTVATITMVVGRQYVSNELPGSVRMSITRHVIILKLHLLAHLVKARCRDGVALAVDLPRDRPIRRTDLVAPTCARGRARVNRQVCAEITASGDHAVEKVVVVVRFVVDNNKRLRLDPDGLLGRGRKQASVAKDAVVERGLVLVDGATVPAL